MTESITSMNIVEIVGLVSGLLCVWLLVRQNIWTWPVGIIYVLASLYVFHEARLYANFLLHLFYMGMNIYGWHYWLKGGERDEQGLRVTREPPGTLLMLTLLALAMALASGFLFKQFSDATLPFWDNAVSVFSLLAMWLQSRKKIESWYYWLAIDLVSIFIYLQTEIYFYSLLYGIYTVLAVMGWHAWRRNLR